MFETETPNLHLKRLRSEFSHRCGHSITSLLVIWRDGQSVDGFTFLSAREHLVKLHNFLDREKGHLSDLPVFDRICEFSEKALIADLEKSNEVLVLVKEYYMRVYLLGIKSE